MWYIDGEQVTDRSPFEGASSDPRKEAELKRESTLFVLGIPLIISLCLNLSAQQSKIDQLYFNKDKTVEGSNLCNISKLFNEIKEDPQESEDYYFIVIGDTRNEVRSYDLGGFNYVARQIFYAKDRKTNEPIWRKIKFIMHTGDIVYNGVGTRQWVNLKRAFSMKDYGDNNYPYIKLLASARPIFPTLGNHEIMKFRLKKETTYRDVADSSKGINNFKDFFNWEQFIREPNVMYPIPSEFKESTFEILLSRLPNEETREIIKKHYVLFKKKSYRLKIYQDAMMEFQEKNLVVESNANLLDKQKKDEVIGDLQPVFKSLGYNTLPVLSSDNMINYAFEIDGLVYIVLDSMARGWHYETFSSLKHTLYKNKSDRHNLHLFSKSDLNGQYDFFREVSEYARKNGKTLVPFFHHSPISSSGRIDGTGREFNYKLMLGIDYKTDKKTGIRQYNEEINRIFFDDIFFQNGSLTGEKPYIKDVFSSCVHFYEKFTLESMINNRPIHTLDWHISGGGGGSLSRKYDHQKLEYAEELYNNRLESTGNQEMSIKIKNDVVKLEYNFLVVHVRDNEIIDVYPNLVDREKVHVKKKHLLKNVKLSFRTYAEPLTAGSIISANFANIGLENVHKLLSIVTWDPSFSLGYVHYDSADLDNWQAAGIISLEPLKFTLSFPKSKYSVSLAGLHYIFSNNTRERKYWSIGLEAPLLYNFFSIGKKISFELGFYYPFRMDVSNDPDFGNDIRGYFGIGYTF